MGYVPFFHPQINYEEEGQKGSLTDDVGLVPHSNKILVKEKYETVGEMVAVTKYLVILSSG